MRSEDRWRCYASRRLLLALAIVLTTLLVDLAIAEQGVDWARLSDEHLEEVYSRWDDYAQELVLGDSQASLARIQARLAAKHQVGSKSQGDSFSEQLTQETLAEEGLAELSAEKPGMMFVVIKTGVDTSAELKRQLGVKWMDQMLSASVSAKVYDTGGTQYVVTTENERGSKRALEYLLQQPEVKKVTLDQVDYFANEQDRKTSASGASLPQQQSHGLPPQARDSFPGGPEAFDAMVAKLGGGGGVGPMPATPPPTPLDDGEQRRALRRLRSQEKSRLMSERRKRKRSASKAKQKGNTTLPNGPKEEL